MTATYKVQVSTPLSSGEKFEVSIAWKLCGEGFCVVNQND